MARVQGIREEEETYPKASPLTFTRVIKGPKNIKSKEIMEVAEEYEEEEHEQMGMKQIPYEGQLPVEDEMKDRSSPMIHSPPNIREIFCEPA